jgi:hypothetical protein
MPWAASRGRVSELELHAQSARFAAQQEFRVGARREDRYAVKVLVGMGLQAL